MSKGQGWMVTGWLMMIVGQGAESTVLVACGMIVVVGSSAMIWLGDK